MSGQFCDLGGNGTSRLPRGGHPRAAKPCCYLHPLTDARSVGSENRDPLDSVITPTRCANWDMSCGWYGWVNGRQPTVPLGRGILISSHKRPAIIGWTDRESSCRPRASFENHLMEPGVSCRLLRLGRASRRAFVDARMYGPFGESKGLTMANDGGGVAQRFGARRNRSGSRGRMRCCE